MLSGLLAVQAGMCPAVPRWLIGISTAPAVGVLCLKAYTARLGGAEIVFVCYGMFTETKLGWSSLFS